MLGVLEKTRELGGLGLGLGCYRLIQYLCWQTPESINSWACISPSFVEQYEYRFDFYSNLAGKACQLCETALRQEGVRAISSFRAKNSERLETKPRQCVAWRREKGNEDAEAAISNELADVAGVRIALYFSDDSRKRCQQNL